jgi:hypothetical protein
MDDGPGSTGRSREDEFRAHPLVAKFIEAVEGDEGVVELRGFIGPAKEGDDRVRLYTTLELTECLLVPRDAIVHVSEPEPEQANDQPTSIYVKGSTELRLISRQVTTIRADVASVATPMMARITPTKACFHLLWWCLDDAGPDFRRQIACFRAYAQCIERWRERLSVSDPSM